MGTKILQYVFHTDRELEILAETLHPVSGARLKLAALNDRCRARNPNARPFIVFWAAPWQKTIKDYRAFPALIDAKQCFTELRKAPPPVTPALRRDFQVEAVYKWERKYIDRHSPNNMTEDHIVRALQKISNDFNMEEPSVNLQPASRRKKRKYSLYHREPYKLDMVSCKLTHAMHEKGHRIDELINDNEWSDHGPSFVRTIIRLADRYQIWQDPVKLEEEAKKMGILVTDDADLPPLPS
jgi:hypothetical protein